VKWEYDLLKTKKKKKRNREYNNRNHPAPLPHASSRQYVKRSNTTKNLHFPFVSITFRSWFFRHLPPPSLLLVPRTAFSLEHNLKSAGRFRRHCVRFLWRHKTLIDIKPRGYFNFLRLHPPPPARSFSIDSFYTTHPICIHPSSSTASTVQHRHLAPSPSYQRHLVIRCPFLSRTHNTHSPGSCCVYRPTFFSDPTPLAGRQKSFPSCFTMLFPATLFDDLINPTASVNVMLCNARLI